MGIDKFNEHVEQTLGVTIRRRSLLRLYMLRQVIVANVENMQKDEKNVFNISVLDFTRMTVEQPGFNYAIREMVEHPIWRLPEETPLARPTWIVYELLRQIGVSPNRKCGRGTSELDPKQMDFLLYKVWDYNPGQMLQFRHRL